MAAVTTNPTDNRLHAIVFGSLSCSRDASNPDPACLLGCHVNPGDLINVAGPVTSTSHIL